MDIVSFGMEMAALAQFPCASSLLCQQRQYRRSTTPIFDDDVQRLFTTGQNARTSLCYVRHMMFVGIYEASL